MKTFTGRVNSMKAQALKFTLLEKKAAVLTLAAHVLQESSSMGKGPKTRVNFYAQRRPHSKQSLLQEPKPTHTHTIQDKFG